jgi:hypothetical protein
MSKFRDEIAHGLEKYSANKYDLLQHMKGHQVKEWLLKGCEEEDAHTIGMAVLRMPEWLLIRRLARVLAEFEDV